MAYRLTRPGEIQIYTEGRRLSGLMMGGLALVIVAAMGWTALQSGWQNEMLGGVFALFFLGGMGAIFLRSEDFLINGQGVRPLRQDTKGPVHADVERLRIDIETRGASSKDPNSRSGRVDYCLDVILHDAGGEDSLRVFSGPSEPVVRQAAEEIAAHMQWPLEDAIGDELEIREPDALDARLDRKPEPAEEPPAGILRCIENGETILALQGLISASQRRILPLIAVAGVSSGLIGAGFAWSVLEGPLASVAVGLMMLGDGLIVAGAWALTRVSEEVVVRQGIAHRQFHIGPFRLESSEIDLRRIERIRIQTRFAVARGCVLVTDDATMRLGRGLEGPALRWLRAWLESRLP